jgi:hypothetical protein
VSSSCEGSASFAAIFVTACGTESYNESRICGSEKKKVTAAVTDAQQIKDV